MLKVEESKIKEDSAEVTAELESELVRLQRQYRLLEDDRKAYRHETEHTLKRQRQVIATLMSEEDDLMKDMNLVTQKSNVLADKKTLEELRNLLKSEDAVKSAIEDENSKLQTFQDDFKKQEEKIEKLWKVTEFHGTDEERYKATQKRIRMLENRLQQSTLRFNNTLARNASHRQNIEYITVQRKRFADLHRKLEKVYKEGVEEKDKLIESSKLLFASREEAENRIRYLKEKSSRDVASFNAELKDLMRIIDHDKRLREFMTTKEIDLTEVYDRVIQSRREKKAMNNLRILQNEFECYDEIFKRLVDVSGFKDVDEMVKHFIEVEDKNFAQFNFVNEQGMERKQYQADIESLKAEIVDLGNLTSTLTAERKKILAELEDKFEKVSQSRKANNREEKMAKKILEGAKTRIWNIFHKINCDMTGIATMLGNSEITEDNMAQFLGVVENRTNELLQIKLMIALKENNEHEISLLHSAWTGQYNKTSTKPSNIPQSDLPDGLGSTANNSRGSQRPSQNATQPPKDAEKTIE